MKSLSLISKTFFLIVGLCVYSGLFAQMVEPESTETEKLDLRTTILEDAVKRLQKLQVSGYIQAQYQYAETDADNRNFKLAAGRNAYEATELKDFSRFGIRRGRIKFTYTENIVSGVIQIDVTEKGISSDRNAVTFKDVYIQVKDPWFGTSSFKAGLFDRPFGHEIAYSSSSRESPERARMIQALFPDERDLGAMLTLQPAKTSPMNILKLEAGLFSGNGIKPQFVSHFDFIGRLSVSKPIDNYMVFGVGVSAYLGGVFQNDKQVYTMKDKQFVLDSDKDDNIGKFAKRQYFGIDAQFSLISAAGLTALRGEYIFGEHPGNASGAYGFNFNATLPSGPVYMRKISGGYIMLAQDLGTTPLTAVLKYDWYNPNTEVSGNDIAAAGSGTGSGDICMSNFGLGMLWRVNAALKLTAYYDFVSNETTDNLKDVKDANGKITRYGWEGNRKDNVFTLRLQYKF